MPGVLKAEKICAAPDHRRSSMSMQFYLSWQEKGLLPKYSFKAYLVKSFSSAKYSPDLQFWMAFTTLAILSISLCCLTPVACAGCWSQRRSVSWGSCLWLKTASWAGTALKLLFHKAICQPGETPSKWISPLLSEVLSANRPWPSWRTLELINLKLGSEWSWACRLRVFDFRHSSVTNWGQENCVPY